MCSFVLRTEGCEKKFNNSSSTVSISLDALTLTNGQALEIKGSSGSGKSTVLAMLGGYLDPTEGSVHIDYRGRSYSPQSFLHSSHIACCFQQSMLEPHLNSLDNCRIFGIKDENTVPILERLGLERMIDQPVHALSGGQQKRVALARCLAARRPLSIIDEPLAGLDEENIHHVCQEIAEHLSSGRTIIYASHQRMNLGIQTISATS